MKPELKKSILSTMDFYYNGFYWDGCGDDGGVDIKPKYNGDASRIGIHKIEIKRDWLTRNIIIKFYCERPGLLIGKQGYEIEHLKNDLKEHHKGCVFLIDFEEYNPFRSNR